MIVICVLVVADFAMLFFAVLFVLSVCYVLICLFIVVRCVAFVVICVLSVCYCCSLFVDFSHVCTRCARGVFFLILLFVIALFVLRFDIGDL